MRVILSFCCLLLFACQPKAESEEEVDLDHLVQIEEEIQPIR